MGRTVGDWVRAAEARLCWTEAPALEAQLLAAHVLRVDRAWLFAHPGCEFPVLAGESLLQRRESHEPLAYILGYREFYGRRFAVSPDVLIPRQETEVLVEAALDRLPPKQEPKVLDVGTGSGCIAVTLALERPLAVVTGADISEDAIDIAKTNARDLRAQIDFLTSDGFEALKGRSFDLIVTNPPYIGTSEILPREVSEFEPAAALYGGANGTEFLERLASEAGCYLAENGSLLTEVGHTQSARCVELFESHGWSLNETRNDLSGVARVLCFKRI